jgi:hypothetical protein
MSLTPRENVLRAIRRERPEWVPYGLESTVWVYPPYRERPLNAGYDDFGVRWAYEPGAEGGTYPDPDGHPIRDLADWRSQLTLPDLDSMDWDTFTLGFSETSVHVEAIDRSRWLVCGIVEMGLFERSYLLLGMEQALIAYAAEPDLMRALLEAIADFKIAMIERFHAAVGLDIISYGDDWGTQSSLFLSPRTWRQVIKPPTRRIYDAMKRHGYIIIQHSCGKISAIFDDLIELGPHIWNPCQPCNDLAALKRRYGKQITFYGGIDSQYVLDRPGVTEDEVRAEVRHRIDELAGGGGYIAWPSHSVPFDPELVRAMEDEIATYGRSFYARQQQEREHGR